MSLSLTFIYASSNRFVASSFRVSRNNREEKSKFRLRPREHIAAVLAVWFHTSTKPFAHFLLCVLCRAALTLTVLFIYLSSGKRCLAKHRQRPGPRAPAENVSICSFEEGGKVKRLVCRGRLSPTGQRRHGGAATRVLTLPRLLLSGVWHRQKADAVKSNAVGELSAGAQNISY